MENKETIKKESWQIDFYEREKKILCKIHLQSKNCECCKNTLNALLLFDEVKKLSYSQGKEEGRKEVLEEGKYNANMRN